MRGRYEKPRGKRREQSPEAGNTYSSPAAGNGYGDMGEYSSTPAGNYYNYGNQNGYNQGGYSQQGYNQNGYSQNGYDQNGYSQQGYQPNGGYTPEDPEPDKKKGSVGAGILSFFLPLIGLILFFVWKKNKPGKAKSAGIGALIGFILTLLLGLGLFFGAKYYINSMFDKVNQVEVTVSYTEATEETEAVTTAPTEVETTEPPHVASKDDYINILVAGQSSRGAEDKEQARFADSMMLITINKYEKKMIMTSLLRDTLVKMPDYKGHTGGMIKLTTVYHLGYVFAGNQIAGSMEVMDMCLYNNFGIEVDYNFEIDFKIFETIINRLGGVTVTLDEAEAKYLDKEMQKSGFGEVYGRIHPGEYPLDGFSGLAFARMRHAEGDGDSDIKRTSRQQRFVKALLDKVKTMKVSELQGIANDVLPMVSTSMNSQEMADLMKLMLTILPDLKLESGGTCPHNYKGEMLDIYKDGFKHSVLRFDPRETKEYMRELTLGEMPASGKSRLTPIEIPGLEETTEATETGETTESPETTEATEAPKAEKPAETTKPETNKK